MSKKECPTCGREDKGHWIGCAEAKPKAAPPAPAEPEKKVEPEPETPVSDEPPAPQCAYGECTEPRWSEHPRAQFCATHKDQANRK